MAYYRKVKRAEELKAGKLMTKEQKEKCNRVIHTATVASAAAGIIPIPIADAIPITAAQVTMGIALGKVFGIKVTDTMAKTILTAVAAPIIGRTIVRGLLKFLPGAGWVLSAMIAAGITEAIGWTIANDFARKYKNNILEGDIISNEIKAEFEEQSDDSEDDE